MEEARHKERLLCYSIHMQCPEQANPKTEKRLETDAGGTNTGFQGDKNILKIRLW